MHKDKTRNYNLKSNIVLPAKRDYTVMPRKYPFALMDVGQSFQAREFSRGAMSTMRGSISYFLKRTKEKEVRFTMRKVFEKDEVDNVAKWMIRVWRTH